MATVHKTPKMVKDKTSGKRAPKLDGKGNVVYLPKWRGKLFLANGNNTTVTLNRNQKESQRLLDKLQEEQDNIRLGVIPLPDKFNKALQRPIEEFFEEYFAWGDTQGGRGKKPWSRGNKALRRLYAKFWRKELGLVTVGDLNMDLVPKIEKVIQRLVKEGVSGKTVNSYRDGLYAPCSWAKKRGYIAVNPVAATEKVNENPTVIRRYEPPEVWQRIIDVSEPYLRMVLGVWGVR